jgi:hypothetical protein
MGRFISARLSRRGHRFRVTRCLLVLEAYAGYYGNRSKARERQHIMFLDIHIFQLSDVITMLRVSMLKR